jgi:hypothetical protein
MNMDEQRRDGLTKLLYQYLKEPDGTLDIDAITGFPTQNQVSQAIFDKSQQMIKDGKMKPAQEDELFKAIDPYFPDETKKPETITMSRTGGL